MELLESLNDSEVWLFPTCVRMAPVSMPSYLKTSSRRQVISHGLRSVITFAQPERMRSKELMVVRLNLLG